MGAQESTDRFPTVATTNNLFLQKEPALELDGSVNGPEGDCIDESPFSSIHRKSELNEYQKGNPQSRKSCFNPGFKKAEVSTANVSQVRLSNQATSETKSSPSRSIVRSLDPEGGSFVGPHPGNLGGSFALPETELPSREKRRSSRSADRNKSMNLAYTSQPDMGRISQFSAASTVQKSVLTESEYLQLMREIYTLLDSPVTYANVSVEDIFTLAASKQQLIVAARHQPGQLSESRLECVAILKSKYADSQRMLASSQAQQQSTRTVLPALILADCSLYSGEWLRGEMDGPGRQVYPDGSTYVGMWAAGKAHGHGCFTTSLGTYTGAFSNGKSHGKGVYWQSDGTRIEGEWVQDVLMGPTIESRPDGYRLEVNYHQGKRHGEANGQLAPGVQFKVIFENDSVIGDYQILYLNEGIYRGQLLDGQMHGQGAFEWSDGRKYQGSYKYGLKHGYGEFLFRDGKIYKGNWEGGKQQGEGTIFHPSGAKETYIWDKGFRVRG